jgi:hypothetical protein
MDHTLATAAKYNRDRSVADARPQFPLDLSQRAGSRAALAACDWKGGEPLLEDGGVGNQGHGVLGGSVPGSPMNADMARIFALFQPSRLARRHGAKLTSLIDDFCNKIGTFRTWLDV